MSTSSRSTLFVLAALATSISWSYLSNYHGFREKTKERLGFTGETWLDQPYGFHPFITVIAILAISGPVAGIMDVWDFFRAR